MKYCSRCDTEKPESDYNKNVASDDGYQNYCRDCQNALNRELYRKKHGEPQKRWSKYGSRAEYMRDYRKKRRELNG